MPIGSKLPRRVCTRQTHSTRSLPGTGSTRLIRLPHSVSARRTRQAREDLRNRHTSSLAETSLDPTSPSSPPRKRSREESSEGSDRPLKRSLDCARSESQTIPCRSPSIASESVSRSRIFPNDSNSCSGHTPGLGSAAESSQLPISVVLAASSDQESLTETEVGSSVVGLESLTDTEELTLPDSYSSIQLVSLSSRASDLEDFSQSLNSSDSSHSTEEAKHNDTFSESAGSTSSSSSQSRSVLRRSPLSDSLSSAWTERSAETEVDEDSWSFHAIELSSSSFVAPEALSTLSPEQSPETDADADSSSCYAIDLKPAGTRSFRNSLVRFSYANHFDLRGSDHESGLPSGDLSSTADSDSVGSLSDFSFRSISSSTQSADSLEEVSSAYDGSGMDEDRISLASLSPLGDSSRNMDSSSAPASNWFSFRFYAPDPQNVQTSPVQADVVSSSSYVAFTSPRARDSRSFSSSVYSVESSASDEDSELADFSSASFSSADPLSSSDLSVSLGSRSDFSESTDRSSRSSFARTRFSSVLSDSGDQSPRAHGPETDDDDQISSNSC